VPWCGASDCPVCHWTVSSAPRPYKSKLSTLWFLRTRSAIIHRTVRCASGASVQRSIAQCLDSATVHGRSQSRSQRRTGQRTVPVRCDTGLSDATRSQCSNGRLRLNPNGWVTWLAHRTVRCALRQTASPTALWWLRAINTP
jgi:hypothetical protein